MTDRDSTDVKRLLQELEREREARKTAERIAEDASLAYAELLDGLEAEREVVRGVEER